ncbi:uncharacterized protein JN550_013544 [Neoarthrinium moseri]|uniref:uncharacterized protein n=1 Tax=Neoarthrinium moseri TaxID=1658444 RepID=UPI001FDDA4E6|nr:uncharacterized protein JN550_013544 [Neoarthrinium moseri]KAI1856978.1 hypothetical protein JN550_013544 [Neoarthrinium moseri]
MKLPPGLMLAGSASTPRGRSLTTQRAIGPGGVIAVFDEPSITIPSSPCLHLTCNYCLAGPEVPVRACTGCRTATYCSPVCQKADWKLVHKGECKVFKRVKAEGHDFLPTGVRALVHMLLRTDMAAAVQEMEAHTEGFRAQKEEWRDMELQALAAMHYLGREASPQSVNEAIDLLCKLQVNSFNREDEDTGDSGIFVNPALAMVNHSCVPNAFVKFAGRKASLHAYRAIKEGEEVEISYIELNLCSLNSDLSTLRNNPSQGLLSSNKDLARLLEEIYPLCSTRLSSSETSENPTAVIRKKWQLCEPLRAAQLFAIEPLPQVMGEASIVLGEREDHPFALAICCFLAITSDAFKYPLPFSPSRLTGLLMIANLLSNTAPISGSKVPAATGSLRERIVQALSEMDQATMTQAILAIFVRWAPMFHTEDSQAFQEGSFQLRDIESLRGRQKERELIRRWARDHNDAEAQMFFEYAVQKPVDKLASFALEIMDAEFGPGQALLTSR